MAAAGSAATGSAASAATTTAATTAAAGLAADLHAELRELARAPAFAFGVGAAELENRTRRRAGIDGGRT